MMHNSLYYFYDLLRTQSILSSLHWIFSHTRYNFFGFLVSYYSAINNNSPEKSELFLKLSINF